MNTAELIETPLVAESKKEEHWTEVIESHTKLLDLRLEELWRYRDLIMMFVRRDFLSTYKQTILGPVWFFLQPLLTSITFLIIFSKVAKISTSGVPPILFYLCGITIWNYFSDCLTKISNVFRDNAGIFGKVYFPRLTMPVSIIISSMIKFCIQLTLFLAVWLYYLMDGESITPNGYLALVPFLVIIMGVMALGLGMIISAMTTKYKDLSFLLTFGIQLLMYATPVIYPLDTISDEYKWILLSNPLTSVIETFRLAFLGSGTFSWFYLGYTVLFTLFVLVIGAVTFNKVQKSFTDTV